MNKSLLITLIILLFPQCLEPNWPIYEIGVNIQEFHEFMERRVEDESKKNVSKS